MLAFTDDDDEFAPDWIGSIARGFADPTVACVTGAVLPLELPSGAACL